MDELFLYFISLLRDDREFIGLFTILMSLFGFSVSYYLYFMVKYSKHDLAKKLASVYKADALKFMITGVFGLAGLLDGPEWLWLLAYTIRPLIMIYLIYALCSLARHFIRMNKDN